MKLNNKNILLISPEPWGINHVSKHHYAIELAKRGNYVYFLNPPSTKFNLRRVQKNLFVFDYTPTYRGLAKMPSFLSAWLIKKEIKKLERICNAIFDIIWNFDSSSFFNLKLLTPKLRISHIVDLTEDKNIKLLNTTTDLCLCTSDYILARQKKYTNNAHNIGHGFAPFEQLIPIKLPKPNASLKVGYVGNLLIKYLDWKLIYNLVTQHTHIDFYFAGPYSKSNLSSSTTMPPYLAPTMDKPNTHFIGTIKPQQIGSFLSKMDVLLLAYKADDFKEQLANPHKLLEYLGSGKVIVSTWTEAYKGNLELLKMVNNHQSFIKIFSTVVNDFKNYNNENQKQLRTKYAIENQYSSQIKKIEELI